MTAARASFAKKDICLAPKSKRENSKSQLQGACDVNGDCVNLSCSNSVCVVANQKSNDQDQNEQQKRDAGDKCQSDNDCTIENQTCQDLPVDRMYSQNSLST
ncbi:uncharacterized protein N7483_010940 [Penicillium malachiteum]|uniref:uncharacterized protein n=1 Tax=Penicillium malachiteum TaxID=1324776 RepID=UPI0025482DF3|nr:uncharacterized protein N7483_010940 [Penicillium malachiteum]KAJ5713759.1 hypothetical protein N7483_010940 [Penicillium malachiteum]